MTAQDACGGPVAGRSEHGAAVRCTFAPPGDGACLAPVTADSGSIAIAPAKFPSPITSMCVLPLAAVLKT